MHSASKFPARLIRMLQAAIVCQLLSIVSAGSLWAGQWQSHASIRDSAREFILGSTEHQQVQVQVGQLDERLRLEPCTQPLQAYFPLYRRKLGRTTVGVRCPGPAGWKVFVPVDIKAFGAVLVAKQALPRNTVLRAADVQVVRRDLSRYGQGFYSSPEQVAGMVVKYAIGQGSVITPRGLEPRQLVSRGESVTIVAQRNGLTIRVRGEALMDGANGDTIRVRNTRSKRELEAVVIAPHTVKVKL